MAPVFIDARPISALLLLVVALGAAAPTATSDTPKGGDASVELELKRARLYLQTGEPARAAELIRSLLPRRDTAELRNLLGDAEEAAGNLLAAAEEFQKAAHMDPTEEHLFDWGNNLLHLRAYEPASQVLAEAVKRYPRSARLQVGLGIAEYSRGQYDDAVRSFCAAADLDPSDPRAYVFLGEMYGVSPDLADEVTRRLALLVRTHPENALGHFHYAMSLWKGRADPAVPVDLGRVESLLKRAVALDPKLALAHFRLGVLYFDQGRFGEAARALHLAIRLQPDLAEARYRLAQVYLRTGEKALAERELEAFRKLGNQGAEPAPPR
jgi:tetratricopeptide (TPR) repeat protein